ERLGRLYNNHYAVEPVEDPYVENFGNDDGEIDVAQSDEDAEEGEAVEEDEENEVEVGRMGEEEEERVLFEMEESPTPAPDIPLTRPRLALTLPAAPAYAR
ncbi:hypothetical protein BGZ73_001403, partial [Actinomortierella ambigua]